MKTLDEILRDERIDITDIEVVRAVLDSNPLACVVFTADEIILDCNQAFYTLFEIPYRRKVLSLLEICPQYQADGVLTQVFTKEKVQEALVKGKIQFEWVHVTSRFEPVPCEVTLVKIKERNILISYIRDLRELYKTIDLLDELEKRAVTDYLTGIHNRYYFSREAEKEFLLSVEKDTSISVVMFDIDKFKNINDAYGHLVGDEIIKMVAYTIGQQTRPIDIFARFGGEEFIVAMPETDIQTALYIAEKMREAVEQSELINCGRTIKVTISIGVAERMKGVKSLQRLMQRADEALYRAKENGRNRVEVYEPLHS